MAILGAVKKKSELPINNAGNSETLARIEAYLATNAVETPCLVLSLQNIRRKYEDLAAAIPEATIHYAIKANPAADILKTLVSLGSNFDAASPNEFRMCLAAGAKPEQILYSNTIKKPSEIEAAYSMGCRLFCFDSDQELEKLAKNAPNSNVLCRIMTEGEGAQWPLSKKFGCNEETAVELLLKAKTLGLNPLGVSFHVGSQMIVLPPWDDAIAKSKRIFEATEKAGMKLEILNLGVGFPAKYKDPIPSIFEQGAYIKASLKKHFGDNQPKLQAEPGRYISAEAGVIVSEVILVSHNHKEDPKRWVFLDVGKFTGLIEPEAIQYEITTDKDGDKKVPVVIAGPTCDSVDIIYESTDYFLPETLTVGDKVKLLATGAYTTTYSAIAFNGFPPLKEVYID